jgi:hypothetical protein
MTPIYTDRFQRFDGIGEKFIDLPTFEKEVVSTSLYPPNAETHTEADLLNWKCGRKCKGFFELYISQLISTEVTTQKVIFLDERMAWIRSRLEDRGFTVITTKPARQTVAMLYRYLPLEQDVVLVARGCDNFTQKQARIDQVLEPFRKDKIDLRHHISLAGRKIEGDTMPAIQGTLEARGPWPGLQDAISAWTSSERQMSYGQDELFLACWLGYRLAGKHVVTCAHKVNAPFQERVIEYIGNSCSKHTVRIA